MQYNSIDCHVISTIQLQNEKLKCQITKTDFEWLLKIKSIIIMKFLIFKSQLFYSELSRNKNQLLELTLTRIISIRSMYSHNHHSRPGNKPTQVY